MSKSWSQVAQNTPQRGGAGHTTSNGVTANALLTDAPALPQAQPRAHAAPKPQKANAWTGAPSTEAQAALDKMDSAPALSTSPAAVPAPANPTALATPVVATNRSRGRRQPGAPDAFTRAAATTDPKYAPRVEVISERDPVVDILCVEAPRASLQPAEVVSVSKKLSQLLRHGALEEGLSISINGYVSLTSLLGLSRFKQVARSTIAKVVSENEKQRFHMAYGKDGEIYIRANQGHSMPGLEVDMHKIVDPNELAVAYHGTKLSIWPHIAAGGLNRMGRQHVHMALDVPGSAKVISGARASSDCIVTVNVAQMVRDGITVLVSANGVVLSEGIDGVIPTKYFVEVNGPRGALWDPVRQQPIEPSA